MNRTTRAGIAALSAALGLGSVLVAGPSVNAADTTSAGAGTSFYDVPSTLPAQDGTVVKTEAMKLGITFPQLGKDTKLPGTATRIMYKSTDDGGQPVGVSGTYIEPSKKWTGKGARPLVSYSVGTQGVADACAPSKTLESFLNVEDNKFMVGYEVPSIYGLLSKGIAVVVTDYVGLGTTNRVHTYMNRRDQAHAVLDAARAALSLPNTSISAASPIGLYGYSQGGGAAAAAAELAPTYAPELNLKGAYAGGPPADLFKVMESIDGTLLTGAIPWAINAMATYRTDLHPYIGKLVNAKGAAYLEKAKDQCIVDTVLAAGFTKTSTWTQSGKAASVDVGKSPELVAAVDHNRIGKLKPQVPVMVLTGTKDDAVAHGQAKQLAVDWCGRGANVTYKPVTQLFSSGGLLLTHMTPMITEMSSSQKWLVERLEGKSVTSNCSAVSRMQ
ncbi:lipase family protein [Nocardioides yefusunii]|uniref:Lipase family protein n=1 Tax=Nocardioides yefusunii TaxID=2500546 RepID=A0ABW1QX46_9ACTN|nr:lipase family protein [Nocardioides yefusunii]